MGQSIQDFSYKDSLNPGVLSAETRGEIIESSKILETKLGYRVLEHPQAEKVENKYHANNVWPQE